MQSIFNSPFIRATVLGLGASVIVGCATSTPTIDTSAEAEQTFDGLYPVNGGRMDLAWARADFSVEQYSKIMLQGVGIEYRPDGSKRSMMTSTKSGEHYEITPAQKERFEAEMGAAFDKELAKGENFEIVTEPGPDVLLIKGGMIDVASFVPPEMGGRSDIYLSRVGEATLVLEMRDSLSGAIILRAIDRRAAEDMTGSFTRSNSVSNMAEARRLAQAWARIVREALDRYMVEGDLAGE
jgi:hypothetical protein